MASLSRWKLISKSRSGRRPISVGKLLQRESEGKVFHKHSSATHDYDYTDNEFNTTGLPARRPLKKWEMPSREEVDVLPNPKTEYRQDSQGTITIGGFASPGGHEDIGKTASRKITKAMETLGELSRTWEVPSMEESRSGQQPDKYHPPTLTLSDIGDTFKEAFIQELQKTAAENHGINPWRGELEGEYGFRHFVDELLTKVSADVSKEQAQGALSRLDSLEHSRPTFGQLARGAALGSVVGPLSSNVSKLISKGELHTPREIAGQIAGGVIFGTAMPMAKYKVESGAERKTLRDYVNNGHSGRLATQIESKLGTP